MSQSLFDRSEFPRENVPSQEPAAGRPRLRTAHRDQVELRMLALDQLLEPDHSARAIWDFVDQLDLSRLLASIQAVEGHVGRNATDPRILLTLWIYATSQGVGSGRQLAELCTKHLAYMWICGGVSLSHHVLSDFRTDNVEVLDDLITQVVGTLMHEGLVTLESVAQDGMRVRASAGKASFRRRLTLRKCLQEAEKQVQAVKTLLEDSPEELTARQKSARQRAAREREKRVREALRQMEELSAKREKRKKGDGETARVSTTDPEARNMKFANGGYHPGYNVQFATDVGSGIIAGVDVTNVGNDSEQMVPMGEQIRERYGRSPKEKLVDGGFTALDQIEQMETVYGTTVYGPIKEESKKRAKGIDPYAPSRGDSEIIAAWRRRMGTEQGREKYKLRSQTAEWSNAQSRNRNFWFFPVRGLWKARGIALLYALTHNLLRGIKLRAEAAAANALAAT